MPGHVWPLVECSILLTLSVRDTGGLRFQNEAILCFNRSVSSVVEFGLVIYGLL